MSISYSGMHAKIGTQLSNHAHLQQSLADILTTPIGSRVMRREYGSLVPELIDQPLNGATKLRLYAATAHAVQRWEPRIRLSAMQLDYNAHGYASLILEGEIEKQGIELRVPFQKNAKEGAA